MKMEDTFLKNLGTGVVSNLIFVAAYLISLCLKKKYKHSECDLWCIHCSSDMQNTSRSNKQPDGETAENIVKFDEKTKRNMSRRHRWNAEDVRAKSEANRKNGWTRRGSGEQGLVGRR